MIRSIIVGVTAAAISISIAGCDDRPEPASYRDVRIGGELHTRLMRSMDRLEEKKYLPENVFLTMKQSWDWPGDTEGRTILALATAAQASGREPKHLDAILARLPKELNERGYLGPVFPGRLHEQQLSGDGWLLRGLCETYLWKRDPALLERIRTLAHNLYLPGRGHYATYPINPAQRSKTEGGASGSIAQDDGTWMLSTDIGCVFIGMDALIQAWGILGDDDLGEVVEEMIARYLQVDFLAIKAQTHATLTGMRGLLRHAEIKGDNALVPEVERIFRLYCDHGMTETFQNYNWFERFDRWTESCAVIDSFIVAVRLWQATGKTEYLDWAHRIYWNGICHLQRHNGGFGLDNGPGKAQNTNALMVATAEAHWCCTMRGGDGLAQAARYSAFTCGNDALLLCPRTGSYSLRPKCGDVAFSCKTEFPFDNSIVIEIDRDMPTSSRLLVYAPDWLDITSAARNGVTFSPKRSHDFACLGEGLRKGSRLIIGYRLKEYELPVGNLDNALAVDRVRKMRGPLLLGLADGNALKPVYHLMDPTLWDKGSGAMRVLWPTAK